MNDVEYDFRTAFDTQMAWAITVGQYQYGMREAELQRVGWLDVGLTVFEPVNIDHLLRFRDQTSHEVVIIALDTIQTAAEQAQRVGNAPGRVQSQDQIKNEREIIRQHADLILTGPLQENIDAISATIRLLRSRGGVVDCETIQSLVKAGTLLTNADPACIQSASYDLRLGRELLFDGHVVSLTPEKSTTSIPPYSFIIAEAEEIADVPKFMAGRFDLRVSHFMRGIILSNGPQVDPGFRGALFCMLYNASDEPVRIKRGDHFATIEFHTTALGTRAIRKTGYHAFENVNRLDADIIERSGSKLLSRIATAAESYKEGRARWVAALSIWVALLVVPAGFAMVVAWDVQKATVELKAKLSEANELLTTLKADRAAAQAPRKGKNKD